MTVRKTNKRVRRYATPQMRRKWVAGVKTESTHRKRLVNHPSAGG